MPNGDDFSYGKNIDGMDVVVYFNFGFIHFRIILILKYVHVSIEIQT